MKDTINKMYTEVTPEYNIDHQTNGEPFVTGFQILWKKLDWVQKSRVREIVGVSKNKFYDLLKDPNKMTVDAMTNLVLYLDKEFPGTCSDTLTTKH